MRIEQLCREFDLEPRWTVFPLHPETPDEGRELSELFAGMDVAGMMAELQRRAAGLGLPFGSRSHTYNSRRAQELGKWAEEQGCGDVFRAAVYHAYFAAGRNIARPGVLLEICQPLGLPLDQAREVLETGSYAASVDADWDRARMLGIRSVPSHVYRNRLLVGFRDYPAFRQLITGDGD